ncbi:hypothetical protein J7M07_03415 [bacterium]|nr:hypothetical protein [bacterium]
MVLIDPVSNHGRDGQEIRQDTSPQESARRNNPNPVNKVPRVHKDSKSNPSNTRYEDNAKENKKTKKSFEKKENTSLQTNSQIKEDGGIIKVEKANNDKTGIFIDKLA